MSAVTRTWSGRLRQLALLTAGLVFASPAVAASMKIEGSLPRDLNKGTFQLIVTVTGVKEDEYARGAKDPADALDQLKARVKVKLPEVSTNDALPVKAELATGDLKFYVAETQSHVEEQLSDTWTFTYYLEVSQTEAGALKAKVGEDGQLKLAVAFTLGGEAQELAEITDKVLTQDLYIVTGTPAFATPVPVAGTMKALRVFWDPATKVDVKGGSATQTDATTLNLYLVDPDVLITGSLPARKYSGDANKEDEAAACSYASPGSDGGSCVACDADVYLDPERIADEVPGIAVRSARVSDGAATIPGLSNGKRYFVFMQYEPDGLGVTECVGGVPSPNFSLTELNGEGDAKIVDVRCFIATAAYGTPLHRDLTLFRAFRDGVLLAWVPGGRSLVNLYYRVSPPLADFIARHPALKARVRGWLEIIANRLRRLYPGVGQVM